MFEKNGSQCVSSCGFITCRRADHDDAVLMEVMKIHKEFVTSTLAALWLPEEAESTLKSKHKKEENVSANYHNLILRSLMAWLGCEFLKLESLASKNTEKRTQFTQ